MTSRVTFGSPWSSQPPPPSSAAAAAAAAASSRRTLLWRLVAVLVVAAQLYASFSAFTPSAAPPPAAATASPVSPPPLPPLAAARAAAATAAAAARLRAEPPPPAAAAAAATQEQLRAAVQLELAELMRGSGRSSVDGGAEVEALRARAEAAEAALAEARAALKAAGLAVAPVTLPLADAPLQPPSPSPSLSPSPTPTPTQSQSLAPPPPPPPPLSASVATASGFCAPFKASEEDAKRELAEAAAAFAASHGGDYLRTQAQQARAAPGYVSLLSRAACRLGVEHAPDVFGRHRGEVTSNPGSGANVCPPHDVELLPSGARRRVQVHDVARRVAAAAGGAGGDGGGVEVSPMGVGADAAFATPSVAALASVTLGLVVVSYDAPKTLASTLESYRAGGLLDLLEDRVCVLSAALPEEIALCLALGFRVYTPARAETRAAVARHHDTVFARFEAADVEAFPHTHLKDGRPATYVGPAALLGYLDMTVDVVIFAEKDWFLSPLVSPRLLARSLLASLAMLSGNTQVVRLRRGDDTNRDGIVNVCAGEGADGNSNFHGGGCSWNTRYVSAMRPRRWKRADACA